MTSLTDAEAQWRHQDSEPETGEVRVDSVHNLIIGSAHVSIRKEINNKVGPIHCF